MQITTSTNIVLDDEYGLCPSMNDWVKHLELEGTIHVWVDINSVPKQYVIVESGQAVFAHTAAENILVHLDIMKLNKDGYVNKAVHDVWLRGG